MHCENLIDLKKIYIQNFVKSSKFFGSLDEFVDRLGAENFACDL